MAVLPQEAAAAPKEMLATAKKGRISSAVTTFQELITKTSVSHPACCRAGSHHIQGVCWADTALCLCVGVADVGKAQCLREFPSLAKK